MTDDRGPQLNKKQRHLTGQARIDCSPALAVQPMPKGTGPDIITLVRADLEGRAEIGKRKYGERLRACNGRDALIDAYQEALDLCVYLRQVIVERIVD